MHARCTDGRCSAGWRKRSATGSSRRSSARRSALPRRRSRGRASSPTPVILRALPPIASWPRRYWRHEGSGQPTRRRRAVPGHIDRRDHGLARTRSQAVGLRRPHAGRRLPRSGSERPPGAASPAPDRGRPRPAGPGGARSGAVGAGAGRRRREPGEATPVAVTPVEVITRKRDGGAVPAADLRAFVLAYATGELPDYQMSAFLMAGYLQGFSREEAGALTEAMVASGRQLDLSRLEGPTVDKHSTGGVADGTTLVVGPLAAALGMKMLKLSGRGLGHTGGTLDKLESIPGFRVERSAEELLDQVERVGLAVAAQSADLVPADKSIYALRDVTGTVANTALIASSVMSKKLAGGASNILLDVKTGSGAFMKDATAAIDLARLCVELGTAAGRRTAAVVSDMGQPLGDLIGNAAEVREAVEVLRGGRRGRLLDLCLTLTGRLAALSGIVATAEAGRDRARQALERGDALERFRDFVAAQGGDPTVVDDLSLLPLAPVSQDITAPVDGWLAAVDAEAVGQVAAALGAGRQRIQDKIDPAVAVELPVKVGDRVSAGDLIGRVAARDEAAATTAAARLLETLRWSDQAVPAPPLVHRVVGR